MANVVNRTTVQYLQFVNTPDYDPTSWIINPDLSALASVPQKYWKVVGDTVVEMDSGEKAAVDAALLSKTFRSLNFKVSSYNTSNQLTSETWYDTDNGDGTYSNIAEQITYTYSGIVLMSRVETVYFYDGTVSSAETYNYYRNDANALIEKKA